MRLESLGTVTPIHSVAIKPRVETIIIGVHFADGASVKDGDVLFTLDCRQVEAEIMRVEAVIAGAEAQLEQAQRDVKRYTELVARNATTVVTLNNAADPGQHVPRERGVQQGDAREPEGPARLVHRSARRSPAASVLPT